MKNIIKRILELDAGEILIYFMIVATFLICFGIYRLLDKLIDKL
jgi:hypothetical protein